MQQSWATKFLSADLPKSVSNNSVRGGVAERGSQKMHGCSSQAKQNKAVLTFAPFQLNLNANFCFTSP